MSEETCDTCRFWQCVGEWWDGRCEDRGGEKVCPAEWCTKWEPGEQIWREAMSKLANGRDD
jgi:hypothetical protein